MTRRDDADAIRQRFAEAVARNQVTILTPLPWRTRLRLRLTHRIDRTGCWLADHGHIEAAVRLWRLCRMW